VLSSQAKEICLYGQAKPTKFLPGQAKPKKFLRLVKPSQSRQIPLACRGLLGGSKAVSFSQKVRNFQIITNVNGF
jgi:hypothetical protein